MNTTPRKITRAITRLYRVDPMLADIAARWDVEPLDVPTVGTNGPGFFYSPEFAQQARQATLDYAAHHEALHIRLGHHVRLAAGQYDKAAWNIAADLAINSLLGSPPEEPVLDGEAFFPGRGSFPDLPEGKSADWYYPHAFRKLYGRDPDEQPEDADGTGAEDSSQDAQDGPQQPGGDPDDQTDPETSDEPTDAQDGSDDGPSDGDQDADQDGDTSSSSGNGEPSDQDSDQGTDGQPGQPDGNDSGADGNQDGDGTGADGQSGGGNQTAPGPAAAPSIRPAIGQLMPAPGDPNAAEVDWMCQTAQAIEAAQGTLPGYMKEIADSLYQAPPMDPRPLLQRFLRQHVRDGYSFKRPHRRRHVPGIILPGRLSTGGGRVFLITDTSGSMGTKQLAKSIRLLEGVLATMPHATVIAAQCDTRLIDEATRTYTRADFPLSLDAIKWHGRGGTDLAPAFLIAARMQPRPDAVVVVSDMYWTVYKCPDPGIPTVWLDVSGASQRQECYRPTFGNLIVLDEWLTRTGARRAA